MSRVFWFFFPPEVAVPRKKEECVVNYLPPPPPKKICWSPNIQNVRMWPYLELGWYRYNWLTWDHTGVVWPPIQYDWCIYTKMLAWGQKDTTRRISCEHKDRHESCVAPSWRTPKITRTHQNLGRGKEAFYRSGLNGAWTYQHLDFRLLAPGTETVSFCCFKLLRIWHLVLVVWEASAYAEYLVSLLS